MTGRTLLQVAVVVWSVGVWCALWSDLSLANVLWGTVVGLGTLRLLPVHGGPRRVRVRPLRVLHYLVYALWSLVKASAVVAWEVVTPRNRIIQGIVEVPLRTTSLGVITLIANTVSLTPGTLTLEVRKRPPSLFVHIMHLRSIEEVRAEVGQLEDLAVRAFPAVPTHTPEEERS